ncbi:stalk domain-containing protein [Cohnella candidum]|uniref:Copper amine oxidase-like N-terminal domain-containing protein n=1 Tax=Cohnella candidum TaxID=2674991 RepID=A0A3G3JYN1_9BACL|nr:stalk domain-containing protein [Cohnella candidum]AYQ73360.1 hypothetical protein EAV92_12730 [Cohnella candidum]
MSASFFKKIAVFCMALLFIPMSSAWAASVIADPTLAKAVRAELRLPSGKTLTPSVLKKLESLYPEESKAKITRLQGLENAVNMQSLFLPGQNIKDLSPIAKLKKLTFLALDGNQIADLSPLSGLRSLEKLVVAGNKIKSLTPLQHLNKLTDLLASNNQVTDLSPVKNMKLQWLLLEGNKIQDLTPLKNHPTLEYLYLDNNLIQDIKVLETIPNLREVSLPDNPLNEESLKVLVDLRNKGVTAVAGRTNNKNGIYGNPIVVSLDDEYVPFDLPPYMKNGTVMVPFRNLFEKLGLEVTWNKDSQTIIGEKEGLKIEMQVGRPSADVNGETVSLPLAPKVVYGSTFVPLRFVAESMDAKLEFDDGPGIAVMRTKQKIASSDNTVEVVAFGKWTPYESDSSKYTKLAIRSSNGSTLVVNVVPKQDLLADTELDAFYKDAKSQLLADSGIEVWEETEETFQGHPSKNVLYYKTEDGFPSFVCTAIFFEADGRFYQVIISEKDTLPEKVLQELDEMAATVKLNP